MRWRGVLIGNALLVALYIELHFEYISFWKHVRGCPVTNYFLSLLDTGPWVAAAVSFVLGVRASRGRQALIAGLLTGIVNAIAWSIAFPSEKANGFILFVLFVPVMLAAFPGGVVGALLWPRETVTGAL